MYPTFSYPFGALIGRTSRSLLRSFTLATAVALAAGTTATAVPVAVTLTNDGPEGGIWLVSPWVAFHDGSFDTFNPGEAASAALEALAEDGNSAPLDAAFVAALPGGLSATLGGPTAPGRSLTHVFELDPMNPNHRYMSYLTMLIPSNDAFAGNPGPTTVQIFDEAGNFIAPSFAIPGSAVYDAGTEVNDEIPANVAFLAQAAPDTGTTEGGTIAMHPGFNALGTGGILDASTEFGGSTSLFSSGDFTVPGYSLARITISMVGNPDNSSNLLNLSTRGLAGQGSETQIAGFVISDGDEKTVLIRAVGPGLGDFGVADALVDPTVEVFDGDDTMIATNDDWESQTGGAAELEALMEATTATGAFEFAPGSTDAALVITLPPGRYTAQIGSKGTDAGPALVEVYEVP